jgi:hypothetical protein
MSEQLQGRELDAALARALGLEVVWIDTWDDEGTPYRQPLIVDVGRVLDYSTDLNAMHEVEAEIERRGLAERYLTELDWQCPLTKFAFWGMTHATAEQRARAALAVLTVVK